MRPALMITHNAASQGGGSTAISSKGNVGRSISCLSSALPRRNPKTVLTAQGANQRAGLCVRQPLTTGAPEAFPAILAGPATAVRFLPVPAELTMTTPASSHSATVLVLCCVSECRRNLTLWLRLRLREPSLPVIALEFRFSRRTASAPSHAFLANNHTAPSFTGAAVVFPAVSSLRFA